MLQGVRRLRAPGPGAAVATVLLLTRISLPLHGEQSPALTECAKALYRADYERASSLAKEYVKAHPQAAEGRILLARAEMAQGKLESAFQQLRRALRADSDHLDTLYFLGRLCVALSQIERQKLYALAPDSSRVHQLLAESYRAQEKLDKAEEEYLAALKADPRSLEVLNALGDLKRSLFQFNEAISYYLQAAGIAPRDYDSAYGLGASYLYKDEPQRAIEYFRHAVALDPRSPAARLALGTALLRASQPAAAIKELKAATALEPNMRQAYPLLARAYKKLGRSREANKALKKAQKLMRKEQQEREALLTADDLAVPAPASPAARNLRRPSD